MMDTTNFFLFLIMLLAGGIIIMLAIIATYVREIREQIFDDLQDGNQEEQSEPGNYGLDKHR